MTEQTEEDTTAALGGDDTTQDDTPQLTETEQLASEMGWRPEADYTGSAPWKPARDFILTEREISRETKKAVKHLREQVDRMAAAGSKQTERMLRQQAEELNRQFAEAVENKDAKGAAQAAQGMRDLEQEARQSSGGADAADAERGFASQNPWYGKDDEATAYAISISQRLAGQGKSVEDQLEAAAAGVRKRFPELFDTAGSKPPPKKDPPALHAPGSGAKRTRAKGFADLPDNVKAAAESHARLAHSRFNIDPEKAKQDYARDYFSDFAA